MKKTLCLALLALLASCSDDGDTPTPEPKAYAFDDSVIKDPAKTIACAVVGDAPFWYLTFTKKTGGDYPYTGDITFDLGQTPHTNPAIDIHFDGGLRINIELSIRFSGDCDEEGLVSGLSLLVGHKKADDPYKTQGAHLSEIYTYALAKRGDAVKTSHPVDLQAKNGDIVSLWLAWGRVSPEGRCTIEYNGSVSFEKIGSPPGGQSGAYRVRK